MTLFAGCPDDGRLSTTYDQSCGFSTAARAMARRRAEDEAAVRKLGATAIHLGHLDEQYGGSDGDAVLADVLAVVDRIAPAVVLGPLGLAHPDHHRGRRILADVLALRPGIEGWAYEDMPARVLWPEQVPDALAWWAGVGFESRLDFLGTGALRRKQTAIRSYESQLGQLAEVCGGALHPCLVPERHHRLARCA